MLALKVHQVRLRPDAVPDMTVRAHRIATEWLGPRNNSGVWFACVAETIALGRATLRGALNAHISYCLGQSGCTPDMFEFETAEQQVRPSGVFEPSWHLIVGGWTPVADVKGGA